MYRTGWLLPGSFSVMNCSSLYFSKAGVRSSTMLGSEAVRALMSASVRVNGGSLEWHTKSGLHHTSNDVCELLGNQRRLAIDDDGGGGGGEEGRNAARRKG